jgi:hypothetical protein
MLAQFAARQGSEDLRILAPYLVLSPVAFVQSFGAIGPSLDAVLQDVSPSLSFHGAGNLRASGLAQVTELTRSDEFKSRSLAAVKRLLGQRGDQLTLMRLCASLRDYSSAIEAADALMKAQVTPEVVDSVRALLRSVPESFDVRVRELHLRVQVADAEALIDKGRVADAAKSLMPFSLENPRDAEAVASHWVTSDAHAKEVWARLLLALARSSPRPLSLGESLAFARFARCAHGSCRRCQENASESAAPPRRRREAVARVGQDFLRVVRPTGSPGWRSRRPRRQPSHTALSTWGDGRKGTAPTMNEQGAAHGIRSVRLHAFIHSFTLLPTRAHARASRSSTARQGKAKVAGGGRGQSSPPRTTP